MYIVQAVASWVAVMLKWLQQQQWRRNNDCDKVRSYIALSSTIFLCWAQPLFYISISSDFLSYATEWEHTHYSAQNTCHILQSFVHKKSGDVSTSKNWNLFICQLVSEEDCIIGANTMFINLRGETCKFDNFWRHLFAALHFCCWIPTQFIIFV